MLNSRILKHHSNPACTGSVRLSLQNVELEVAHYKAHGKRKGNRSLMILELEKL